jgi:RNA polymerase sigma factor (sigma-70 family)
VNFNRPFLQTDERDIIDSILQKGPDRKKGEERLFNRYAYFIQQAVHKYAVSQEEAFDIYCDTILAAIEKIADGSFQGRSSLKTWLYQIFSNKYVDLLRKKTTNKNIVHRTVAITDMFVQFSDPSKTVIQTLTEKTDWELLVQKLKQLGDSCHQLLTLWADGYTDKEIAISLQYKTPDVVKTSRLRCLGKLKQLYQKT